ncbi:aminotransferase class V-fold PLP-dependent enzyme [Cellulomonas fengjieae]|uniref:Aminotransferase class V-fold PLP-dependent enzyme n=1 Tax=Cellulomonas fengjieae TaxID=2819978 RepID=A0ABS3SCW7_9CELL|nr:aminotransferase class V-fold PLP-dependent enzyme [Cellulomonas fengjieae]MBO3083164.1 aminotransferase class V-fold PLP-dependent enzyme [Cellulomonas fengjieae]QVI65475.1 aminotransferase class V-fold PLP-dependent enzyme [Cellulomonas fengjieae]
MQSLATLRAAFAPVPGYLDAATCGLPARATVDAMHAALDTWQAGKADLGIYDEAVAASRTSYARLVGVDPSWVAVGSQTSVLVGMAAATVPDGAEVLAVDGDFSSVTFPFVAHADRGVTVRHVPLESLADEVRPGTHTVAFSLVQSRDGRVADVDAVLAAATAVGARTVCDITQGAGWLPVDASRFDITACATYKWLAAPRGTAFLTVRPEHLDLLRPSAAGWYAGAQIWSSVYGPTMALAQDARRFDVSPAWLCWVGAAPALDLFADAPAQDLHRYAVGLADAFRAGLGLAPGGSAIVALADDAVGSRRALLAAGGTRAAGRGGGVRLGFHVWNDTDDVARAVAALRGP